MRPDEDSDVDKGNWMQCEWNSSYSGQETYRRDTLFKVSPSSLARRKRRGEDMRPTPRVRVQRAGCIPAQRRDSAVV